MYHLGESTYCEDKAEFEQKYPDRLAIDLLRTGGRPYHDDSPSAGSNACEVSATGSTDIDMYGGVNEGLPAVLDDDFHVSADGGGCGGGGAGGGVSEVSALGAGAGTVSGVAIGELNQEESNASPGVAYWQATAHSEQDSGYVDLESNNSNITNISSEDRMATNCCDAPETTSAVHSPMQTMPSSG